MIACCCRAQMVADFAVLWHGLVAAVEANGFESIVEPTVQRWFSEEFKAAHPEVLDEVRAMVRRTRVEGYLGCIGAFLGLSLEKRLPELPSGAGYEDASRADRIGVRVLHRSATRGSSQGISCSSGSAGSYSSVTW